MRLVQMILYFFVFLIHPLDVRAQQTCPVIGPEVNYSTYYSKPFDELKSLQVRFAQNDMAGFCKRNMVLRFLNTKDSPPANCEHLPTKELERHLDRFLIHLRKQNWEKNPGKEYLYDPWGASLMSTQETRSWSLEYIFKVYGNSQLGLVDFKSLRDFFKMPKPTYIKSKILQTAEPQSPLLQIFLAPLAQLISPTEKIASGLCNEKIYRIPEDCKNGIKKVIGKINLVDMMSTISTPEIWRKVYENPDIYDDGLRRIALKILDHIESGNIPKDANIFDDLMTSFRQAGFSQTKAKQYTFEILALYGGAGANMPFRVGAIEPSGPLSSQKSVALNLIGLSITYLDYVKQQQGKPLYAYPANVDSDCDNAKPYFFWLAAYLARSLIQEENFEAEQARAITHIFLKTYSLQRAIFAKVNNGFASIGLLTRSPFDPAHQIVRTDLAIGSIGSLFGALSTKRNENKIRLNINTVIVDLLTDSKSFSPLDQTEKTFLRSLEFSAAEYKLWDDIFSPDTAYNSASSQAK